MLLSPSFTSYSSLYLSKQQPLSFPISSCIIPSQSMNPCIHPTQPTLIASSVHLSIFFSRCFNPSFHSSPLFVFRSPSFPPHRELAGWSWRRRWRRGQVVTTMTSGGADAVPAVAAKRRWTIWGSAPSMAVSLWSWLCVCMHVFVTLLNLSVIVDFFRFTTLQFENQMAKISHSGFILSMSESESTD